MADLRRARDEVQDADILELRLDTVRDPDPGRGPGRMPAPRHRHLPPTLGGGILRRLRRRPPRTAAARVGGGRGICRCGARRPVRAGLSDEHRRAARRAVDARLRWRAARSPRTSLRDARDAGSGHEDCRAGHEAQRHDRGVRSAAAPAWAPSSSRSGWGCRVSPRACSPPAPGRAGRTRGMGGPPARCRPQLSGAVSVSAKSAATRLCTASSDGRSPIHSRRRCTTRRSRQRGSTRSISRSRPRTPRISSLSPGPGPAGRERHRPLQGVARWPVAPDAEASRCGRAEHADSGGRRVARDEHGCGRVPGAAPAEAAAQRHSRDRARRRRCGARRGRALRREGAHRHGRVRGGMSRRSDIAAALDVQAAAWPPRTRQLGPAGERHARWHRASRRRDATGPAHAFDGRFVYDLVYNPPRTRLLEKPARPAAPRSAASTCSWRRRSAVHAGGRAAPDAGVMRAAAARDLRTRLPT